MNTRSARVWLVAASLFAVAAGPHAQTPNPKPKPSTSSRSGSTEKSTAAPSATGALLLIADADCVASIDGKEIGSLRAGAPHQARVPLGQHFVRAVVNGVQWEQIVDVTNTTQLVLTIPIASAIAKRNDDARNAAEAESKAREESAAREAEAKKTPQQKAQDVALRAVAALGGLDAIQAIRTVVLEYRNSSSRYGVSEKKEYIRRPGEVRNESEDSNGEISINVTVGQQGWSKLGDEPARPATTPRPDYIFFDTYVDIATGKSACEVGRSTTQEISLLCEGGNVHVFDAASGLPRSSSGNGLSFTYSDYRKVRGYMWPFAQHSTADFGGLIGRMEDSDSYSLVEFNRELDPALFRKPKD